MSNLNAKCRDEIWHHKLESWGYQMVKKSWR